MSPSSAPATHQRTRPLPPPRAYSPQDHSRPPRPRSRHQAIRCISRSARRGRAGNRRHDHAPRLTRGSTRRRPAHWAGFAQAAHGAPRHLALVHPGSLTGPPRYRRACGPWMPRPPPRVRKGSCSAAALSTGTIDRVCLSSHAPSRGVVHPYCTLGPGFALPRPGTFNHRRRQPTRPCSGARPARTRQAACLGATRPRHAARPGTCETRARPACRCGSRPRGDYRSTTS